MMRLRYIAILWLMMYSLMIGAQEGVALVDTSLARTHGMRGFSNFDPTQYQLQHMWRPADHDTTFAKIKWFRRFVFGISTGYDLVTDFHYNTKQIPIQGYIGYQITPIHQLRLQGGIEQMERQKQYTKDRTASLELQYLANLTNLNKGFNNSRLVDISTLIGAGVRHYGGMERQEAPYVKGGLDVSFRIGSAMSLFVQPYAGLMRRVPRSFVLTEASKLQALYGVNAGLELNLRRNEEQFSAMSPAFRNFFVEGTTGWGFNLEALNPSQSGSNMYVGLGHWVSPLFGLRLGVMGQQNYWNKEQSRQNTHITHLNHHVALAGRAEVMMSLRNLKRSNRESLTDPLWDINLSVGGMYGYNAKVGVPDTKGTWRCYYYGVTAATQALLKVSPGSYIFIEPRFFNNIYRIPYVNAENKYSTEQERFMAMSVGTRVHFSPIKEIRKNNRDTSFVSRWWIAAGVGGMKMFETTRVKYDNFGTYQPAANVSLGWDVHRLVTLRAQAEWSQLARVSGNWKSRYQIFDARLLYMLPLNNLVRGLEPNARLQTYIELGPTISAIARQKDMPLDGLDEHAPGKPAYRTSCKTFGAMAGAMVTYAVTPSWDLYTEVQGQYYEKTTFIPGDHPRINNLRWGLSVGSRYHLPRINEYEQLHLTAPDKMKGWFIEGQTGWINPIGRRSGSMYKASLGRWLNATTGFRLGLRAQQYYGAEDNKGTTVYPSRVHAVGFIEGMTNLLNWSSRLRENADKRWFDLDVFAGITGGPTVKKMNGTHETHHFDIGLTAGLQGLFHVAPGVQIYAEPSVMTPRFQSCFLAPRAAEYPVSLSMGARLTRPDDARRKRLDGFKGENDEKHLSTEFNRNWWIGIQAGGSKQLLCEKSVGTGRMTRFLPTASMNLGYDFTSLNTLRLQTEMSILNKNYEHPDGTHYAMFDLRTLYMLNLTNLWCGTRNNPRFSIYPEAGVAYSHKNYAVSKENDHLNSFGVVGGVMAAMRINRNTDITIESQVQQNFTKQYMNQHHDLEANMKWNFTVGTRYHLQTGDKMQEQLQRPDWMKGWFFETGYGLTMPLDEDGISCRTDFNWRGSFGYWLNTLIGVRAGFATSRTNWSTSATGAKIDRMTGEQIHGPYHTAYLQRNWGGRLELLVNPLGLIRSRNNSDHAPLFDLNVGLGLEVGQSIRAQIGKDDLERQASVGAVATLQALFRVAPTTQLYIEPAFHTSGQDAKSSLNANSRSINPYLDINIGTRITRPVETDRQSLKEAKGAFKRHLWVGADVMTARSLHYITHYDERQGFQPAFALNVGYDIHPLASVRLQAQYAAMNLMEIDKPYEVTSSHGTPIVYTGNFSMKYGVANLRALYMLNLTNLWQGYPKNPRLQAYLQLGPTMGLITNQSVELNDGEMVGGNNPTVADKDYSGRMAAGVAGGLNLTLRVARDWDITFDNIFQHNFNTKNFMPIVNRSGASQFVVDFGLGVRYRIK